MYDRMKFLLYLCSCCLLFIVSCTEPITVGSDLLQTDRAGVGQIVDLPITARVVREDSLLTYIGGSNFVPGGFTLGRISDANFGTTTHSVYLTPRLPTATGNLTVIPPFSSQPNTRIDSIVVLLPIDTLRGFYGPGRDFPLSVREIESRISLEDDRYSDFSTNTEIEEIGAAPSYRTSLTPVEVRDTAINGQEFKRAHLRIRLSDAFVQRFDDLPVAAFDTDSVFRQNFAGIFLTPTAVTDALVNLAPSGLSGDTPYAGFNCYYRDSTGTAREYRIAFSQALPNYASDFSGSVAGELLDGGADSSLIAVAGRGGLLTELTFEDLSTLSDKVVNRAALEVTVADVAGVTYTDYPLPPRLELFYRVPSNGLLGRTDDRNALFGLRNTELNVNFFLAGNLITEDGRRYYDPAFTLHLQRMIEGEVPNRLYIRSFPGDAAAPVSPARAFLNGPEAATDPARVRITFTQLSQ